MSDLTIYFIGGIGVWLIADSVASLWSYTRPERKDNQTFWGDHALRILRGCLGLYLFILGAIIIS